MCLLSYNVFGRENVKSQLAAESRRRPVSHAAAEALLSIAQRKWGISVLGAPLSRGRAAACVEGLDQTLLTWTWQVDGAKGCHHGAHSIVPQHSTGRPSASPYLSFNPHSPPTGARGHSNLYSKGQGSSVFVKSGE